MLWICFSKLATLVDLILTTLLYSANSVDPIYINFIHVNPIYLVGRQRHLIVLSVDVIIDNRLFVIILVIKQFNIHNLVFVILKLVM